MKRHSIGKGWYITLPDEWKDVPERNGFRMTDGASVIDIDIQDQRHNKNVRRVIRQWKYKEIFRDRICGVGGLRDEALGPSEDSYIDPDKGWEPWKIEGFCFATYSKSAYDADRELMLRKLDKGICADGVLIHMSFEVPENVEGLDYEDRMSELLELGDSLEWEAREE